MNNLEFKNKKVAILGMGIEGIALADFLIEKVDDITILDKLQENEIIKNLEGDLLTTFQSLVSNKKTKKIFGENYLDNLSNFDLIFRTPGLSYLNEKIQEAVKGGTEVSSQIRLFFDLAPCKIIGVTGTKGKGTTSSLIYEIIKNAHTQSRIPYSEKPKVFLAGNIGYPAVSLLEKLKPEDVVILELSSFQLMDLHKSPDIAVIVNLTVDHQDYHKNIEEYRESKFNILK